MSRTSMHIIASCWNRGDSKHVHLSVMFPLWWNGAVKYLWPLQLADNYEWTQIGPLLTEDKSMVLVGF